MQQEIGVVDYMHYNPRMKWPCSQQDFGAQATMCGINDLGIQTCKLLSFGRKIDLLLVDLIKLRTYAVVVNWENLDGYHLFRLINFVMSLLQKYIVIFGGPPRPGKLFSKIQILCDIH